MENSKILLQRAMSALNTARISEEQWAIGGGTVLAYFFNHRISKDIDVFLKDRQYLNGLSPRLNETNEQALAYNEQNGFISLTYPEGKVDYIVAAQISEFMPQRHSFFGEKVYLEDPVEIVVKKIFHRGEFVLTRDMFDLAVVAQSNRQKDLMNELRNISDKVEQMLAVMERRQTDFTSNAYSVKFVDSIIDEKYLFEGKEFSICKNFLNECLK